jgi:methionyl-tRNA formyltransferase
VRHYGFRPGIGYTVHRILSCTPRMTHMHDPHRYRIVFFSGSPVGVPFLEEIARDKRFEVVGVVTMPDSPSGRGQQMHKNIIGVKAEELRIPTILTPHRIHPEKTAEGKICAETLKSLKADYFVVVAYGKIFPQQVLDIPSQ